MDKCLDTKVGYKIFLCEPHRITTVAIAERIAFERREEVGQTVGYQIPLETKWVLQFFVAKSALSSSTGFSKIWRVSGHCIKFKDFALILLVHSCAVLP